MAHALGCTAARAAIEIPTGTLQGLEFQLMIDYLKNFKKPKGMRRDGILSYTGTQNEV